jgi:hypothetical protein
MFRLRGNHLRTHLRPVVPALIALAVIGSLLVPGQASAAPVKDPTRHRSGLALLPPADKSAPKPTPEPAAQLLSDAGHLAEQNPADFSYPWLDEATGEVVLDTTTARGRDTLAGWKADRRSAGARQRLRTVKASRATFEKVRTDITTLTSAVLAGQEHITAVTPDGANNRLILDVDLLDDGLLDRLAARYGTELIAVRYEQPTDRGRLQARENDTAGGLGFYGGANLRSNTNGDGCTSGFSWYDGATNYMLSAGHCFREGGGAWTPIDNMGFVTPNSRENWQMGTGTQYFTGQGTYRGDLALVELSNGLHSAGKVYSGGYNSSSSRSVKEMWSRSPARGDQFCSDGRRSGEQCGWVVQQTGFDYRLSTGEWVRPTTAANKYSGPCTIGGDSGGPVYTIRGDGGVAAKGIWSWGGGGVNGNGTSLIPCSGGFTDIYLAYYGLPGYLRLG